MENCIYCDKIFTKRGVKRHTNKCNKKSPTPIKNNKSYNSNAIFVLPDDCLRIIQEFLLCNEMYNTHKRFFSIHLNYALSCKIFYSIFLLDSKKYQLLYNEEINTKIDRRKSSYMYGLTDNDLDIIYGNKKHRQIRQRDKIYQLDKIMDFSCNKYGSYNNYIDEKNRIELEKKKQKEIKLLEIKQREEQIIELLKQHNLLLRDDSTLCYGFIENNIGDVTEIVTIMVEMDFYFKYTNYSSIFYDYKSNYIYNARSYNNYYYSLSNEEKNKLSKSSKKEALKGWCMKQKKYDDAINQKYLPKSLHDKIKDYFSSLM